MNQRNNHYRLLGQTGLRVSPFCLGTMTFGTEWGWGSPREAVFSLLHRFLDLGHNFIDTADGYTGGTSESMIGEFLAETGKREDIVLATKFSFNTKEGDPNAGGNGRKNILRSIDASLKRLRTDYIDLYWMHTWDGVTPMEEVLATFDSLVKSGKIRAFGFSNVPAWYAAKAHTMSDLRGAERLAALQFEYSLVERNIEREHIPMALELGLGLCPWSPLAGGLLTGKYRKTEGHFQGDGRLKHFVGSEHPAFSKLFFDRNFDVVEKLVRVAEQLGRSPAQVALNWVSTQPGVTSTIVGATHIGQLENNLDALSFEIPLHLRNELDDISKIEVVHPYMFFGSYVQKILQGNTQIDR